MTALSLAEHGTKWTGLDQEESHVQPVGSQSCCKVSDRCYTTSYRLHAVQSVGLDETLRLEPNDEFNSRKLVHTN